MSKALLMIFLLFGLTSPKEKYHEKIPEIDAVCWSVTNYWPFHDEKLVPHRGQANEDPWHFANMTPVTRDLEWKSAAGPLSLVGRQFIFPDESVLDINDTFGAKAYQDGVFWHDFYHQWVIGVDIFTKEPLHYLECEGRIN